LKPSSQARLLGVFSTALEQGSQRGSALKAMLDAVRVPLKIETDEIKLMSPHFNGAKVDLRGTAYDGGDPSKVGPAVFNTALHPTATAVARVALELVMRQIDGPVVVMAGGVAAGKGFAAQKANFDDSDAVIIYDSDGESSQTFIDAVQAIAARTGNEVRMVGVITDPVAAWLRAVHRAFDQGRTVSETAFAYSHSTGVENMIISARKMKERGQDVVLIDNNTWPKLYEGAPPPPMDFKKAYGQIKDITDSLERTGRVPEWVQEAFADNDYMLNQVIEPLEAKMADPSQSPQRKAIFDSLKEDRHVFAYAHA